jgi:hypothetical protein
MQDESLTFTKKKINFYTNQFSVDVIFHFKNTSTNAITRKIAFAFPPVYCNEEHHSMWMGLESQGEEDAYLNGFKDFTLMVDGKRIEPVKRITAVHHGKDITKLLNQLQIPLNPCLIKFTKEGKLDPRYADKLAANHLIGADGLPAWGENIYMEWTQEFPPGKVIEITHHYTPVAGVTVPSPQTLFNINSYFTQRQPPYTPIWSTDPATLVQTNPAIVYKATDVYSSNEVRICTIPSWLLYRLTTGAYWNGGIGEFHLSIIDESGEPFAVNKFYSADDVVETKSSANKMDFTLHHFVPKQDLMIMYLAVPVTKDDLKSCGIE